MIWSPLLWPRWAQISALAALAIAAFLAWDWFDDRAAVREHERDIAEQVERKSIEASHAATDAAQATKSSVEKSNADARAAASDSPDPLRAGLDSLRGAAANRPATR